LWLLYELRLRPGAALLATALAMWNPYRNEIWTSLTLAEGVAMPFALFGLVCAARAGNARRALAWDVAGLLGVLAALGCKNTFAALVPVQMLLRVTPEGVTWKEGVRRHGFRACLLGLSLALPVGHYLYFKWHWHPGQYQVAGASWAGLGRYLHSLTGAVNLEFMGLGIGLTLLALGCGGRTSCRPEDSAGNCTLPGGADLRRAALVGTLLLVCGVLVYAPMAVVSGRYTIPAVWGLDVLIAVLAHKLTLVGSVTRRRLAYAALAGGLAAVMVASVGKQVKFAARAAFLWQTLEYVEKNAPPGVCVAWRSGPGLNIEEGIHFCWHLQARGRPDIQMRLLTDRGEQQRRVELRPGTHEPDLLICEAGVAPGEGWRKLRDWSAPVWGRKLRNECSLWGRVVAATPVSSLHP
jgi:hypothetical protein